ncbi:MAG: hypothetical protein O7H41_15005 [Planctomycetota bacterium]|nr:hypothetical protein [Planctomycetota bacterium]
MRMVCACLVGAFIVVLVGGVTAQEEARDAKIKDLKNQIEQRIKEKDWTKAGSAIRKLRLLVKGEQREEADALLLRVKGEKEWEKVSKARRGKTRPGKLLGKLRHFLKKYGENEELRERAEELRAAIRKDVIYVIDDFEEADSDDYGRDTEIVPVRNRGEEEGHGLRWKTESRREEELQFHFDVSDWTPYESLSFWIYAEEKGGRLTIDCVTDNDHFFEAWNNIDWTGWKQIRIPLQGRGSRFRKKGKPAWSNIQWIRFWKDEGKPIDIIIDDMQLEKAM